MDVSLNPSNDPTVVVIAVNISPMTLLFHSRQAHIDPSARVNSYSIALELIIITLAS